MSFRSVMNNQKMFFRGGNVSQDGAIIHKTVVTTETQSGTKTLTGDEMLGGLLLLDPGTGNRACNFPAASVIAAAGPHTGKLGATMTVRIRHTGPDKVLTIGGGANVTLSPTVVRLNAGEEVTFLLVRTAVAAYTIYAFGLSGGSWSVDDVIHVTADNTAGNSVLEASEIIGGLIRRNPTGGARADKMPVATSLMAEMSRGSAGDAVFFRIENIGDAVDELITLSTAQSGWTFSPASIVIRPGELREFYAVITTVGTGMTLYDVTPTRIQPILINPVGTGITAHRTLTVEELIGGHIAFDSNGAYNLVMPTGTQLHAALSDLIGQAAPLGTALEFVLRNTNDDLNLFTVTFGANGSADVDASVLIYPGQEVTYIAQISAANTFVLYEKCRNTEVQSGFVRYDNAITAELVSIIAAVDAANGDQGAPAAQPDYPRVLQYRTVDGSTTLTYTATVVGVDVNGEVVTEVYERTAGATSTEVGTQPFATVTSVVLSAVANAGGGRTFGVGLGDVFALPTRPGGMLVGIHKHNEDDANETIGTIVEEMNSVVPAHACNTTLDFSWLYTYV